MEDQHGDIGASGGREDNDYDGYKQTEEDRDTTTITKETIKPSELAMIVFDPQPYKKSLEKVNKKSKKNDPNPMGTSKIRKASTPQRRPVRVPLGRSMKRCLLMNWISWPSMKPDKKM
jgi:hypothetical protein